MVMNTSVSKKTRRIAVMAALVFIAGGLFIRCKMNKDKAAASDHCRAKPFQDENFSYLLHLLEDYL